MTYKKSQFGNNQENSKNETTKKRWFFKREKSMNPIRISGPSPKVHIKTYEEHLAEAQIHPNSFLNQNTQFLSKIRLNRSRSESVRNSSRNSFIAPSECSKNSWRSKKREVEATADTQGNYQSENTEKNIEKKPFSEQFDEFYKKMKKMPFMDSAFKIRKRLRTQHSEKNRIFLKTQKTKKLKDLDLNEAQAKISQRVLHVGNKTDRLLEKRLKKLRFNLGKNSEKIDKKISMKNEDILLGYKSLIEKKFHTLKTTGNMPSLRIPKNDNWSNYVANFKHFLMQVKQKKLEELKVDLKKDCRAKESSRIKKILKDRVDHFTKTTGLDMLQKEKKEENRRCYNVRSFSQKQFKIY